jgi:hypothetical protein
MRTERRVVIKRSAELEAGIELAGPDEEYLGLPFEIAKEDLTDSEAADRRRDERVEDVMPSINLSLIAPLDVPSQSGEARDAWGIAAVGADRCVEEAAASRSPSSTLESTATTLLSPRPISNSWTSSLIRKAKRAARPTSLEDMVPRCPHCLRCRR